MKAMLGTEKGEEEIEASVVDEMGATGELSNAGEKSAAGAVVVPDSPVSMWIVDSGASMDVVRTANVTGLRTKTMRPIALQSANGMMSLDTCCPMFIRGLDLQIAPALADETPDLLAMGLRT